jgi:long-chain acyl-CoA synthetase
MEIQTHALFGRTGIKVYAERPTTIGNVLENTVSLYPNKEALIFNEKIKSYDQLDRESEALAAGLQKCYRIKKGDRIATIVGNCIEFPIILFACAKLGAIMVPINVKLAADEIDYIIGHSKPAAIFCQSDFTSILKDISNKHEKISPLETTIIYIDNQEDSRYSSLLTYLSPLEHVQVSEEDPAYILYTSGTTGRPKGAVLSHIGVIHSLINYQTTFLTDDSMKTLIAIPLFHVTGLIGQLLHMVYTGGTTVILSRYQNEDYIKKVQQYKINFLFNVPAIFIMMSTSPLFKQYSFDFVKKVAFGGAPIYQHTLNMLRDSFPNASLHNAYGATETSSPATLMPISYPMSKASSVGLPVKVADLKVVNAKGNECPPNTEGELLIKGPMVISEYWDNPEANKSNFINSYWLSGDIAKIDEDGYVYILDRKKDMINRGGEKIFSIEVEDVLKGHPQVVEAAVVGIPDPVFGERVKAYVVSTHLSMDQMESLKGYCSQYLAKYKIPEEFELIESLPRNASGKILKNSLRK